MATHLQRKVVSNVAIQEAWVCRINTTMMMPDVYGMVTLAGHRTLNCVPRKSIC